MEKKSILLINNNQSEVNTLMEILIDEYDVDLADSSMVGIKKTRDLSFDFVIIDEAIDEGHGIAVLELIKDIKTSIPVLLIDDDFDDNSLLVDSFVGNSINIIKKPYEREFVLNALEAFSSTVQQKIISSNIVILGKNSVGKTSLINRFLHDEFLDSLPTIGLNLETYISGDNYFKFFDIGGQEVYKGSIWTDVARKADAVVFVLDSSTDVEKIKESSEWFWEVVNEWAPKDIPILLIANKNDLPSISLSTIIDIFQLEKLSVTRHAFNFISTSAKTGQGVGSFKWLLEKASKKGSVDQLSVYRNFYVYNQNFEEILSISRSGVTDANLPSLINKYEEFTNSEVRENFFKIDENNCVFIEKINTFFFTLYGNIENNASLKKLISNIFHKVYHLILPISDKSLRKEKFNWLIQQELPEFYSNKLSGLLKEKIEEIGLIFSQWDENYGPKVLQTFFKTVHVDINPDELVISCYMTAISIFGHEGKINPSFVTLPLQFSNIEARIYFDSVDDSDVRGGQRIYSIITLLPELTLVNLPAHDKIIKSRFELFRETKVLSLRETYKELLEKIS